MLVRSTGLGRTELEGDVKSLDVKADYIIIGMKTFEPVKWHVRVAANFSDLITIMRLLLFSGPGWKFLTIQSLKALRGLFKKNRVFVRPEDY